MIPPADVSARGPDPATTTLVTHPRARRYARHPPDHANPEPSEVRRPGTRSLRERRRKLIRTPECFSFPSGHAAAGLSIWLPLALAQPGVARVARLALGLLVGLSRCYLGVHYPGDVAAGWLLALLSMLPFGRPI